MPLTPGGTLKEVSLTSPALSPNIALKSLSSGDSCVSPLGDILPTNMSLGLTSAPICITPSLSKKDKFSSLTLGISRVISSLPSFVSLDTHSNSSI